MIKKRKGMFDWLKPLINIPQSDVNQYLGFMSPSTSNPNCGCFGAHIARLKNKKRFIDESQDFGYLFWDGEDIFLKSIHKNKKLAQVKTKELFYSLDITKENDSEEPSDPFSGLKWRCSMAEGVKRLIKWANE